MSCCPACGGLIGRDCFNPQECMQIVRDQAALYPQLMEHEQAIAFLRKQIDDMEKKNANLRESVIFLENRIAAMNEVFGKIRMEVGGNQFNQQHPEDFDPDSPWLPVGLMQEIDGVMIREYRQ